MPHNKFTTTELFLQYIKYYRNSSVVVDLLWSRYRVPQNVFLVSVSFCHFVRSDFAAVMLRYEIGWKEIIQNNIFLSIVTQLCHIYSICVGGVRQGKV